MKIAATYENGRIFQHFGHTETFKVYEVEDGRILGSEIIGSNGSGHGALAKLLNEQGIDVLICGGIGGGAQAALEERGIELCAGAEGDADQGVSSTTPAPTATITMARTIPAGTTAAASTAAGTMTAASTTAARAATEGSRARTAASGSAPTTGAPSTTAPSSIPPMTGASPWNSSAARAR